jgi:hypothetical protein
MKGNYCPATGKILQKTGRLINSAFGFVLFLFTYTFDG